MKTYTLEHPDKGTITYTDGKRYLWLLSFAFPAIPFAGIWLYLTFNNELALLFPLVFFYIIVPLLDWLIGVDENNPPEEIVPQLDDDPYYRILTYITIPVHFIVLLFMAWFVGTHDISLFGVIAVAFATGLYSGFGINTGHELGHKPTALERRLAKIVLAVPFYGHFCVEHTRGHHKHVATFEDPASARMGESIYKFARREIPGAFRRAWKIEDERLQRKGLSVWSWDNDIIQSMSISIVLQIGLIAAFGWVMIPFLVIHNFWAWWQLTSANYIEHYGLLRSKSDDGDYERCQPWHSWNANHILSNILLFHLERHSDHHANPTRRYQSLRQFDDLPQLPNGYFGMYLLSCFPMLWYKVMDPRLLKLKHINADLNKINIDPDREEQIYARYATAV